MKLWKANWSDVEFQIWITKYRWYIQSIYFLHRFAQEHWKWLLLDDRVSSWILHSSTFFELTVIKWTKTVPVQLIYIWWCRYCGSSAIKSSVFTCYVMTTQLLCVKFLLLTIELDHILWLSRWNITAKANTLVKTFCIRNHVYLSFCLVVAKEATWVQLLLWISN